MNIGEVKVTVKTSAMKPPPQIPLSMQAPIIETPPQPLPQPMQRRPSKEIKRTAMYPVRVINQNKNPNIGLNLKNGVEIISNINSIDKLTENLRNISNIISNSSPNQSIPQPMPTVKKPEASKTLEEVKESIFTRGSDGEVDEEKKLEKICGEHERVVNLILEEEENIVAAHKQHIDEIVEMVKQEMQLLQELDKPDSDIESYATLLDSTLSNKVEAVNSLRKKLSSFRSHLRREKELSKKFFEQQNTIERKNDTITPMTVET